MGEILIGTVSGDGATIAIYAEESGGNTTFRIEVVDGYADLRGFFFDYAGGTITLNTSTDLAYDSDGTLLTTAVTNYRLGTEADGDDITKVGSSDNNLNGTGETFDAGLEFGTSGMGKDDIASITFTINGLTLLEIDGLTYGIRATSVGSTETIRTDSVKLIGEFEVPPQVKNVTVSPDNAVTDADAGNTFSIVVTFDQVMNTSITPTLTLTGGDLTGTLSNPVGSWSADGKTFTVTYDVADAGVDFDAITVGVSGAVDQDGTPQLPYTPEVKFSVDTENPTVQVNIEDASLNDGDALSVVTFTFSEIPANFTEADITPVGGTITNLQATLDPLVYTATFTADQDFEGTGSVTVGSDWQDGVGNAGVGDDDTVAIDTKNPTVTVNIEDASLNDGDAVSVVTFTFSEIPANFTEADITPVGGTITNLQATLDPLVYTATFTADQDFEGTGSVTVGSDWQDGVGNAGVGDDDTVAIDTKNPTVTVNIEDASLSDDDNSSLVTFEFSEDVFDFTSADLTAANGTLSNFQQIDGNSYTATFTANDNINATGSVSVTGAYADAAGNVGGTGSDSVAINTLNVAPVPYIMDFNSAPTSGIQKTYKEGTEPMVLSVIDQEAQETLLFSNFYNSDSDIEAKALAGLSSPLRLSLESGGTFDLQSLWVSAGNGNSTLTGYNSAGVEVASINISNFTGTLTLNDAWNEVAYVDITGAGGNNALVFDDVYYSVISTVT